MSEVCNHSEADKDTAIFDGLCPLCLVERIHELEAANRWVPVGERLPKAGQLVLMWIQLHSYVPGAEKMGAYMPMVDDLFPWRDTWSVNYYKTGEVTHWRPLPEPPATDGQP